MNVRLAPQILLQRNSGMALYSSIRDLIPLFCMNRRVPFLVQIGLLSQKSHPSDTETQLVIDIPPFIDSSLYTEGFFYPAIAPEQLFIKALFLQQQRLTLDDAYRMVSYQTVVGRRCSPFFDQWYAKLVLSEVSLFTLSQYLFGRNTKLFLQQWKACKDDLPVEFWVAYWSEQLWQAAQFITEAQTYGVAEAKKSAFKLLQNS